MPGASARALNTGLQAAANGQKGVFGCSVAQERPTMTLFRILGPLEVQDEGRLVPLGGTKQRAVLAILLLNRGEVVSVDRLADELWGEQPPDTATKTVQVYVSRLRKELGQDVLLTRGGGYLLDIEPAQLDAALFERLTDEGRAALERGEANTASDLLREALALWRGTPLGRPRLRAVCPERDRASRGAAARRPRAPHRRRPRARRGGRAGPRAGDARAGASGPRAPAGAAHPCALPLRPPVGRARLLSRCPEDAGRGARHRAGPRAAGARARHPRSGSGDRRPGALD